MKRSFGLVVVAALCVAAGTSEWAMRAYAQDNNRLAPLRFENWPILVRDAQGVFLYSTEAASVPLSPYQNNLAMGYKTLNPTTHRSPRCNSSDGFDGFCGDEVAFGAYTLSRDVTGRDNTAIGDHALANLISGTGNTAVGSSAAANIRTTSGVDAFGVAACQNGTDYRGPITCIGQASLEFAEPASQYTLAVGYQAGLHTKVAEFSTILGTAAGFSAVTNSYSVLVGEGACHNATAIGNSICIGTINGPAGGAMSDTLWVGGNNGSTPILYGILGTNALGVNTTKLTPGAALTVAGGTIAFPSGANISASTDGGVEVGGATQAGGHIAAAYVRTVPTKVANLKAIDPSPKLGDRALVTDARTCAFGTAVAAGGSAICPVYYNGTSWVAG